MMEKRSLSDCAVMVKSLAWVFESMMSCDSVPELDELWGLSMLSDDISDRLKAIEDERGGAA